VNKVVAFQVVLLRNGICKSLLYVQDTASFEWCKSRSGQNLLGKIGFFELARQMR